MPIRAGCGAKRHRAGQTTGVAVRPPAALTHPPQAASDSGASGGAPAAETTAPTPSPQFLPTSPTLAAPYQPVIRVEAGPAPTGPAPTTDLQASAVVAASVAEIAADAAGRTGRIQPQDVPEALWRELARHGLLLPLLRQSVIAAAVAAESLSEEESHEARQAWGAANRLTSAEAVMRHLHVHALEESDALWQAELPRRVARHCETHFVHRAEQRFLARKTQLDQVIYSLLRVQDGALARELYLRIAEGEADFAELAARYSHGPERSTRGVVGPVPLLQAHPALAEALRTSRPGQLMAPLRIEQWWLVMRLESLRSASFDEAMRERMARELFEEWVEEEVQTILESRRRP